MVSRAPGFRGLLPQNPSRRRFYIPTTTLFFVHGTVHSPSLFTRDTVCVALFLWQNGNDSNGKKRWLIRWLCAQVRRGNVPAKMLALRRSSQTLHEYAWRVVIPLRVRRCPVMVCIVLVVVRRAQRLLVHSDAPRLLEYSQFPDPSFRPLILIHFPFESGTISLLIPALLLNHLTRLKLRSYLEVRLDKFEMGKGKFLLTSTREYVDEDQLSDEDKALLARMREYVVGLTLEGIDAFNARKAKTPKMGRLHGGSGPTAHYDSEDEQVQPSESVSHPEGNQSLPQRGFAEESGDGSSPSKDTEGSASSERSLERGQGRTSLRPTLCIGDVPHSDDLVSLPQVSISLCNVLGIGPNFVVDVGIYRHFDAARVNESNINSISIFLALSC
ncbi:hypothetical protein A2U01_0001112 [Trifolium medium]|uniref:Uncharacterized protein n=1 Tax=Trifolium medium TaxID=97028 RepID=A0A392LZE5_9FABA|nr:hypothetical protein [Trifolium medium]